MNKLKSDTSESNHTLYRAIGIPDTPELRDKFWSMAVTSESKEECWSWNGATRNKYGVMRIPGAGRSVQAIMAHRISWTIHNGEIPHKKGIFHKCDNPVCANPEHLFLGDLKDNIADMISKGRGGMQLGKFPVKYGSDNPSAKISEDAAKAIIVLSDAGFTGRQLSELFGLDKSYIRRIARGENWAHLQKNSEV